MGTDKGLVEFRGQPLIAHMLRILRDAGLPASIAGARANLSGLAPVVDDLDSDRGPLEGICSALAAASASWAVFVPIDLPFLPAQLIRSLLDRAELTGNAITLPSLNGFAQTFPCILNRAILPGLRRELEAGRNGCFASFRRVASGSGKSVGVVPVEQLAQTGRVKHPDALPAARWFFNLNSPADLERAAWFRAGSDRPIQTCRAGQSYRVS